MEGSPYITAIILCSSNYLENLPRTLFQPFLKLGRINYTHLALPLLEIRSKPISAISRVIVPSSITTLPL